MTSPPARRVAFDEFARDVTSVFDAIDRAHEPVTIERAGHLYKIQREDPEQPDIWMGYDASRVREALRQSAGALAGVDREQLLADLRTQRGQDTPGRSAD